MFQGVLQKMLTEWADPIRYYLPMEGDFVLMNQLIGKDITLQFVRFQCMNCGEKQNQSSVRAIAKSVFLKSLKPPIG